VAQWINSVASARNAAQKASHAVFDTGLTLPPADERHDDVFRTRVGLNPSGTTTQIAGLHPAARSVLSASSSLMTHALNGTDGDHRLHAPNGVAESSAQISFNPNSTITRFPADIAPGFFALAAAHQQQEQQQQHEQQQQQHHQYQYSGFLSAPSDDGVAPMQSPVANPFARTISGTVPNPFSRPEAATAASDSTSTSPYQGVGSADLSALANPFRAASAAPGDTARSDSGSDASADSIPVEREEAPQRPRSRKRSYESPSKS